MNRIKAKTVRLGGLLALVLGAAALLALPAVGTAKDHSHDGNRDGGARHDGPAGTVGTFNATSGKLTIALTGGETLSGLVDKTTQLRCEGVEHHRGDRSLMSQGGPGSSEPGDDNGGHGNEPGDDNGGQGEEPGDDNGGHNHADCTTALLVPGAVIQEAEVRASGGVATFEEVDLAQAR